MPGAFGIYLAHHSKYDFSPVFVFFLIHKIPIHDKEADCPGMEGSAPTDDRSECVSTPGGCHVVVYF